MYESGDDFWRNTSLVREKIFVQKCTRKGSQKRLKDFFGGFAKGKTIFYP